MQKGEDIVLTSQHIELGKSYLNTSKEKVKIKASEYID